MPSTVIGIVRQMVYFWEMFDILLQPRCTNPKCGSYDLEATGKIIPVLPPLYYCTGGDMTAPVVPIMNFLHEYKCNKCGDVSCQ